MATSNPPKPFLSKPFYFSINLTILLLFGLLFNPTIVRGAFNSADNIETYTESEGFVPALEFIQTEHGPQSGNEVNIVLAKAVPAMRQDIIEAINTLELTFDTKTRLINKGSETVTLKLEGGGDESYTVTLQSSDLDTIFPVTNRLTYVGPNAVFPINIKAVKEGFATITAEASWGLPPTGTWDSDKELPDAGRTPLPISEDDLKKLRSVNGFREDHAQRMHEFAQEKNVFLIVRDGNTDSVKFFGDDDKMPKAMSCKAKTAAVGPYKGLVVDPTHPTQEKYWDEAIANADSESEKERLTDKRKKAVDTWELYGAEMQTKYGYRVNEAGLVQLQDQGGQWKAIHGDYDLHGVYRRTAEGNVEHVSFGSGQKGSKGGVLRDQLNNKLTSGGKNFIQHGGQDDWIPDPNKVPVKYSDPPATVFFPDGRPPLRLSTPEEMRAFYESEMGIPWQYSDIVDVKKKEKERDEEAGGDSDYVLRVPKTELSIKVLDLEALKPLLIPEPVQKDLSKGSIPDLDLPDDDKKHLEEEGYADLFLEAAYELAAKKLNLNEENSLPKEGFALLPSKTVIDDVEDKRDFVTQLFEEMGDSTFRLSIDSFESALNIAGRETKTPDEVKKKIADLGKIKTNFKTDLENIINEPYKVIEKKLIDEAYGEFLRRVAADPVMQERLISVQAFYDLYKANEDKIGEYIEIVTKANQFVNAAVYLYREGPKGVLKVLLIKAAKSGCREGLEFYAAPVCVSTGISIGGPVVGSFVGYVVSEGIKYVACDVLIDEFFREEPKRIYSDDEYVNSYVKIFYTGEPVDNKENLPQTWMKEVPYDVNFYSRFGWKRDDSLDKFKDPETLNRALGNHLTKIWNNHPELREYLDIKGDIPGIEWDNSYKGIQIWQAIYKTAGEDLRLAFKEKLEEEEPNNRPTEIEKYFTMESGSEESGSWLFGEQNPPIVFTEYPFPEHDEPIEVSLGESKSIQPKLSVLGFAGRDDTITVQFISPGGGWLTGSSSEEIDTKFEFPEDDVEVDELVQIKPISKPFKLTIDEERFDPGQSFTLKMITKYKSKAFSTIDIPFKVKEEEEDTEEKKTTEDDSEPGLTVTLVDGGWDTPFHALQYLIHITGAWTTGGFQEGDSHMLFTSPHEDGKLPTPDGYGGIFTYRADSSSGPHKTPRSVCNAASGFTTRFFTAWYNGASFNCDDM